MSSAARVLPSGHLLGRFCKCRRRFNARGAGGGSSRRNKVKVSPFPPGRGGRGDRGKKSIIWQEKQARQDTAPPPGTTTAGRANAARVQPRGCKGRSPLHENNLSLPPFPPGRGQGGYPSPSGKGGKNKAKGGVGGQPKQPRPPTRHRGGRASRRQRRQATPAGTANAPPSQCRAGARPPLPPTGHPLFFCHRPPPIKNSGKILGGLGASFKKPPTHLCPRRLFPPLPRPRRL